MNTVMISVLAIVCAALVAAFLVIWQKYEAEKEKRWDEMSENLSLEKTIEALKQAMRGDGEAIVWYVNELSREVEKNEILTSKLASILCPQNNHVWKDGVCTKCGRAYNGR